ncbi:MAG: hypothetical protein HY370_08875 [Proteobacteria bacterium]|nr:hypothetical protein [Pseudomonadota bacterium]
MTKYDAYVRFKWMETYLRTQDAGDSYLRISGYPSGAAETIRVYVRDEAEPLTKLEIKFLPDIPKLPDMLRMPIPPPQKQPI